MFEYTRPCAGNFSLHKEVDVIGDKMADVILK
jgi:hypothetical protein